MHHPIQGPRELDPLTGGRCHGLATAESEGVPRSEAVAKGERVGRVGGVQVRVPPHHLRRVAPIGVGGVALALEDRRRRLPVDRHLTTLLGSGRCRHGHERGKAQREPHGLLQHESVTDHDPPPRAGPRSHVGKKRRAHSAGRDRRDRAHGFLRGLEQVDSVCSTRSVCAIPLWWYCASVFPMRSVSRRSVTVNKQIGTVRSASTHTVRRKRSSCRRFRSGASRLVVHDESVCRGREIKTHVV